MKTIVDWPALNTLVWLRLPCCNAEHPSRVEDFTDELCIVGTPMAPHTAYVSPPTGEGFFLGWINEGPLEAPVQLVTHVDSPIPMWTLRSIGEAIPTQRRSYVRLDFQLPVDLYLITGGAPARATTLDLSEGGMRVELDRWANDPGVRVFTVEFEIDGKPICVSGQSVWWGKFDENGKRTFGFKFVNLEPSVADTIRGYIFARQLEERRRKLA